MFGFVNRVPYQSGGWHDGSLDHTMNDTDGYMFLVNLNQPGSVIFQSVVTNLTVGQRYEYSAYLTNICKDPTGYLIDPRVRLEVHDTTSSASTSLIMRLLTDGVPRTTTLNWTKYGLTFVARNDSAILKMLSNASQGGGNDLAIDDIELYACATSSVISASLSR